MTRPFEYGPSFRFLGFRMLWLARILNLLLGSIGFSLYLAFLDLLLDSRGGTGVLLAQPPPKKPRNSLAPESERRAIDFIARLPAMRSHYCRSGSRRKYLPREVRSYERVYQKYAEEVPSPISKSAFFRIMKTKFNIGIHVPRKDKCLVCVREGRKEVPSAE